MHHCPATSAKDFVDHYVGAVQEFRSSVLTIRISSKDFDEELIKKRIRSRDENVYKERHLDHETQISSSSSTPSVSFPDTYQSLIIFRVIMLSNISLILALTLSLLSYVKATPVPAAEAVVTGLCVENGCKLDTNGLVFGCNYGNVSFLTHPTFTFSSTIGLAYERVNNSAVV
jgi:hypothetical protein